MEILWTKNHPHEGNPRRSLTEILREVDGVKNHRLGATGRKFRKYLAISSISEPEAVELAYAQVLPPGHPCRVIVSAGGETFIVYHLDE